MGSGQIVLCTIDQHFADLMQLLGVLVPGGYLAYDDPLGDMCVTIFQLITRSGYIPPCGDNENLVECLLKVARSPLGENNE